MAARLVSAMRQHGLQKTLWFILRESKFPNYAPTKLVGQDSFGNKYYEDRTLALGRHRYVDYRDFSECDTSSVPAEWHKWLHSMTDEVPRDDEKKPWQIQHLANVTGSQEDYVPYSTIGKKKIESWAPPQ